MKAEIVCASRELFGSDRSAVRLASLLSGLGLDAALAFPAARPERGLSRLATVARIAAEPAPVVVASSRGVSGLLSLARARPSGEAAVVTIYNSSAVVARAGDSPPRAVVLREWLRPESIRHRALARWLTMRTRGVIATSHGVARAWRACAGDRIPVEVCHNWLDDGWLEAAPEREREGILFVGRLNAWKGQETPRRRIPAGLRQLKARAVAHVPRRRAARAARFTPTPSAFAAAARPPAGACSS